MNTERKVRFGILGTSRIAKKSAIPAIIVSDEAQLVMIGSRDADNARICAEEFGCDGYGTYDEVLASPDIDAVYISLPNSLHEEWAIKAAQAGKHVWCEKPAALTYASAQRMVAACRHNNVRLIEGFMFLYHPQHAKVREIIQSGALGKIISFNGIFSFPMPAPDNIRMNADLGGGVLNDACTYPIRASRMIFETEPESIEGRLTIDPQTGVDIKAEVNLVYPGGILATASAAFEEGYRSTYEVIGSKGRLWLERAYAVPRDMPVKIYVEKDGDVQEITIGPTDQFKLMIDEFCREIRKGDTSTARYEDDLLQQARLLEASRRSHEESRMMQLAEIN